MAVNPGPSRLGRVLPQRLPDRDNLQLARRRAHRNARRDGVGPMVVLICHCRDYLINGRTSICPVGETIAPRTEPRDLRASWCAAARQWQGRRGASRGGRAPVLHSCNAAIRTASAKRWSASIDPDTLVYSCLPILPSKSTASPDSRANLNTFIFTPSPSFDFDAPDVLRHLRRSMSRARARPKVLPIADLESNVADQAP